MIAAHLTAKAQWPNQGSFSLVEAIVAIPIVGVMLVSALNTVGAARLTQQRTLQLQQGHPLAQSLLAEINALAYEDAADAVGLIGPSVEERAPGNRSLFNDVNDYSGWNASPPQTKDGLPLPAGARWRESVWVEFLDPATFDPTGGADLGLARVTVTVLYDEEPLATVTAFRSRGLPQLQACCLPNRTCQNLPQADCEAYGGRPRGSEQRCCTTTCSAAVAHWKFDEGTGSVAVDSAGGHNATLSGPSWTVGKYGGALQFRVGGATVAHNDALTLTSQLTIAAWIKKSTVMGYDTIYFKGHHGSVNYYLDTYGDEILFGYYSGGWVDFVTPACNLTRNRWYHVAATYDSVGRAVKIYVDGALVYSSSLAGDPPPVVLLPGNTTDPLIGNSVYLVEAFDGTIDDLRIYNVAMDAAGIPTIMAGGDPAPPGPSPSEE